MKSLSIKSLSIIRAAVIGLACVFFGTTAFSADTNTTIIGKQLAKNGHSHKAPPKAGKSKAAQAS